MSPPMNCNNIIPLLFPSAFIVGCWIVSVPAPNVIFCLSYSPPYSSTMQLFFYLFHFLFSLHYHFKILLLSYHRQHNSIIFPTHSTLLNPLLGDPVLKTETWVLLLPLSGTLIHTRQENHQNWNHNYHNFQPIIQLWPPLLECSHATPVRTVDPWD